MKNPLVAMAFALLFQQSVLAQSWSTFKGAALDSTKKGDSAKAEILWRQALNVLGETKTEDERACEAKLELARMKIVQQEFVEAENLLRPVYIAVCVEHRAANASARACISEYGELLKRQGKISEANSVESCRACIHDSSDGDLDISRKLSTFNDLMRDARKHLANDFVADAKLDAEAARKKAADALQVLESEWMLSHIAALQNDLKVAEERCRAAGRAAAEKFGPWSRVYGQLLEMHAALMRKMHCVDVADRDEQLAKQIARKLADCRAQTTAVDPGSYNFNWSAGVVSNLGRNTIGGSFSASSSSVSAASGSTNPQTVNVSAYTKADGTEVNAHIRTAPNDTVTDNFSYRANQNNTAGAGTSVLYQGSPTAHELMRNTKSISNTPAFH